LAKKKKLAHYDKLNNVFRSDLLPLEVEWAVHRQKIDASAFPTTPTNQNKFTEIFVVLTVFC